MPKRPSAPADDIPSSAKARATGDNKPSRTQQIDENGEELQFEDPWEDDVEADEDDEDEVVDSAHGDEDGALRGGI
jgi:hypothetical protein